MKKYLPILILLLLIGCKPKQILIDRTVYKVDSTEITSLKSEVRTKSIQIGILKTDLERTRDENTRLQSEASSHHIDYDTNAPVNPETGNYPKASETITESKSLFEKTVKEHKKTITDLTKKIEDVTDTNNSLEITVKKLTQENKDLKQKITPTTGFNFQLFFTGFAVGIFLMIALILYLKFR